jgi:anti-sigma factor RsiW
MRDHDLELQRYFDGEMEPDERARFETALTADDRERLAALGEMRALLNATLEADAAGVDVWSGVSKQLTADARPRRRRRQIWSGASVFLAAAAALVFFLRPGMSPIASNNCDVEDLQFHGAYASVIQLDELPGNTTVIWTEDEEDQVEEN